MRALLDNRILLTALCGWLFAQIMKLCIDLVRTRRINLRYLASAGGMPSSHSAFVTSLATAVARQDGLDSPLFAMCFVFGAIVMYDAAGVRQAVSIQARI